MFENCFNDKNLPNSERNTVEYEIAHGEYETVKDMWQKWYDLDTQCLKLMSKSSSLLNNLTFTGGKYQESL